MKYCSYNGRHSLRASYNVLKNHPDYGVNAAPTVCYICKKPMFYTPFFDTIRFGSYIFINDNALENYFDNVEALDKINYMHPKDFDFLRNDINLDLSNF